MSGFTCPYCCEIMSISCSTENYTLLNFNGSSESHFFNPKIKPTVRMMFYKCPSCEKVTIICEGYSNDVKDLLIHILPNSCAKKYPEYVPAQIRQDYEEACAIVNLSPKASATLSRRCLQGMIRDFWDIKKETLFKEIIELKDKIHPTQWKVIDGVRRIGNIGAHMEKDVNLIIDIEPHESMKLIELIELLINDWYVRRHEQEELYKAISKIDADKVAKRK